MSTLTLPIIFDRKYVRRDGVIVTARKLHPNLNPDYAYVGTDVTDAGRESTGHTKGHECVHREKGRVHHSGPDHKNDLVADYIEPEPVDAELPKGHPYAVILRAIADGKQIGMTPVEGSTRLEKCDAAEVFTEIVNGRLGPHRFGVMPKTITINGHEVPEPLRTEPPINSTYFYVVIAAHQLVAQTAWNSPGEDRVLLHKGLCHTTREAAELHARALLSFTQVAS